jgi:VanZ family protein
MSLRLWGPPIAYAVLIFFLSSLSSPLPALTSTVWDKLLHAAEYAVLASLLCRALRGERLGWTRAIGLALALASAYAATDEWHQWFVPGRSADVRDYLADTLGAAAGAVLYARVVRRSGEAQTALPR